MKLNFIDFRKFLYGLIEKKNHKANQINKQTNTPTRTKAYKQINI